MVSVSVSTLRLRFFQSRSRSRHWDSDHFSLGLGLVIETQTFSVSVSVSLLRLRHFQSRSRSRWSKSGLAHPWGGVMRQSRKNMITSFVNSIILDYISFYKSITEVLTLRIWEKPHQLRFLATFSRFPVCVHLCKSLRVLQDLWLIIKNIHCFIFFK